MSELVEGFKDYTGKKKYQEMTDQDLVDVIDTLKQNQLRLEQEIDDLYREWNNLRHSKRSEDRQEAKIVYNNYDQAIKDLSKTSKELNLANTEFNARRQAKANQNKR